MDNSSVVTDWILLIYADEYLTPELGAEIKNNLKKLEADVSGVEVLLKRVF